MAGTTPLGFPLFDAGSTVNPLHLPLNAMSNAMNDAVDEIVNGVDGSYASVKSWAAPAANSAAERNVIWPAPVQGNRVYRTDWGWEEAYFEAYHPTNNKGGAQVAGWYPVSGAMPFIALTAASQQAVSNVTTLTKWANPGVGTSRSHGGAEWFTYANGIITVKVPGYYNIHAATQIGVGTGIAQQAIRRMSPTPVWQLASERYALHSAELTNVLMTAPNRVPVSVNDSFAVQSILGQAYNAFQGADGNNVGAGRFVIEWAGVFR